MPEPLDRTALYRVRNAEGDLLYIGISRQPEFRWSGHRRHHAWWSEVAHYSIEWHSSRDAAEAAENEAIKSELPRHNGKHNHLVPFDPAGWGPIRDHIKHPVLAERIRSEIRSGRWLPGYRIPPFEALAAAASVSRNVVQRAVQQLRAEGLLDWRHGEGTYVQATS
jgi:predicted GIY-YIG superfamily endonuclease